MINYKEQLEDGNSSRKCRVCKDNIPKGMLSINFTYTINDWSRAVRVCAVCIIGIERCIPANKKKEYLKIAVAKQLMTRRE